MKARGAFVLLGISVFSLWGGATRAANTGAPNPADPAYITAEAAYLKAQADKENADVNAYLAWSERELNIAQANKNMAAVRYIDTMRQIMENEYAEIAKQQQRIDRLCDGLRANQTLMEQIRIGKTTPAAFNAMIVLMATALEFDPIRDAFNRKVNALPKNNFLSNDDENDDAIPPQDFAGGDVRHLLLFVKKNNYSLHPLYDAHFIIMDSLSVVSKSAAMRVLQNEQEIQAIRAARIAEAFQVPT